MTADRWNLWFWERGDVVLVSHIYIYIYAGNGRRKELGLGLALTLLFPNFLPLFLFFRSTQDIGNFNLFGGVLS